VEEDRLAYRAILLLVGAFALAFVVPAGAILLVASRIDFDLDLDIGPKGCGQDPPSGTDLHGFDAATGRERWRRDLKGESSLLGFDRGTAVMLEDDGTLTGIDGRTGRERWSHELHEEDADAVVGDGLVAAVEKYDVVAFDVRSGRPRWRISPGPYLPTRPRAIAGGVAIVEQGRTTLGLDASTGEERWRSPEPLGADVASGGLLFVREGYETLKAMNATSGATLWIFEAPPVDPDLASLLSLVNNPTIAAGPVVGITLFDTPATAVPPTTSTVFLDALTGEERWRTASGALSSFSFDPATNTLYEYGEERVLIARDPLTGTPRWHADTHFGHLLANNSRVFAADETVRAFDATTGALRWRKPTGSHACPVGVSSDVVAVLSA
jgi:outer membrane protein assembly factor BamB